MGVLSDGGGERVLLMGVVDGSKPSLGLSAET